MNVDFFTSFTYSWAQAGIVDVLDDSQYKLGWSFIGATPPTVEQFNAVHQLADKKLAWLYQNVKAVTDNAGVTLGPTVYTGLLTAIQRAAAHGRRAFTENGTFVVPATITKIRVSGCGGGGGGGGGGGSTTSTTGVAGGGGGAGMFAIDQEITVTPGQTLTIQIGGAGLGGTAGTTAVRAGDGTNGGASSVVGFVTLTGGSGGKGGASSASAGLSEGGAGFPAGGRAAPHSASPLIYSLGGMGAGGPFGGAGAAGASSAGDPSAGNNAYGHGVGGGGGGAQVTANGNGTAGGNGAPGLIILEW
ncbi:hypothetical protein [Bordetella petrii]|uniref:glycine-rich domain-containing protein n=1 Tax=Bordetella petrii TaxID=94624 RepID=UPI003732FF6E